MSVTRPRPEEPQRWRQHGARRGSRGSRRWLAPKLVYAGLLGALMMCTVLYGTCTADSRQTEAGSDEEVRLRAGTARLRPAEAGRYPSGEGGGEGGTSDAPRLFLVRFREGTAQALRDDLVQGGGAAVLSLVDPSTLLVHAPPSAVAEYGSRHGAAVAEYGPDLKISPEIARVVAGASSASSSTSSVGAAAHGTATVRPRQGRQPPPHSSTGAGSGDQECAAERSQAAAAEDLAAAAYASVANIAGQLPRYRPGGSEVDDGLLGASVQLLPTLPVEARRGLARAWAEGLAAALGRGGGGGTEAGEGVLWTWFAALPGWRPGGRCCGWSPC
ncbi:hypothetical protein HYH03_017131 [Edaphochlamys debaryana]|uniref:Inhibitor I9 domain-containing protein n=1 Tax=Edaphochlamys debaryana TaxID=47281 RepID=A0A835XKQ5_9CHLO|nr:hypothetical protein HYH03_017131 [Edaphochlamys debaryana]|eukprot:KAG2484041.1 hypothetical protein HYH03_017131 [Edaphochlamys debaryana]